MVAKTFKNIYIVGTNGISSSNSNSNSPLGTDAISMSSFDLIWLSYQLTPIQCENSKYFQSVFHVDSTSSHLFLKHFMMWKQCCFNQLLHSGSGSSSFHWVCWFDFAVFELLKWWTAIWEEVCPRRKWNSLNTVLWEIGSDASRGKVWYSPAYIGNGSLEGNPQSKINELTSRYDVFCIICLNGE